MSLTPVSALCRCCSLDVCFSITPWPYHIKYFLKPQFLAINSLAPSVVNHYSYTSTEKFNSLVNMPFTSKRHCPTKFATVDNDCTRMAPLTDHRVEKHISIPFAVQLIELVTAFSSRILAKLRGEMGWNFCTRGIGKNLVAVSIPVASTIFFTDLFIQMSEE